MPLFRPLAFILATFYFAGPVLILSETLSPSLSLPIVALLLLWAVPLTRIPLDSVARLPRPFSGTRIASSVAAAALCFIWVYYSGIGGYAFLHWDYVKHNLFFSALLEQRLPITGEISNQLYFLHYNFAYYIIPVRLLQFFESLGIRLKLDPLLLYLYAAALFLSVFFLARARVSVLLLTIVLVFVGGLDALGMVAFHVPPWIVVTVPHLGIGVPANLEWWGLPYAPQSFTMNLYWAPQHFFAALIGTALLVVLSQLGRPAVLRIADALILVAASAFWSPYAAVGLSALALIYLLVDGTGLKLLSAESLAPLRTLHGIAAWSFAVVFTLLALLFYSAAESLSSPSPIFLHGSVLVWLMTYVINYAPVLILFALLFWPRAWNADSASDDCRAAARSLVSALAACLIGSAILLLVTHGRYNDWAMRATLPLYFALALLLAQGLSVGLKRSYLTAMTGVLLLSSASSMSQIAQALLFAPNRAPYGAFQLKDMGDLASQYQGRPDSIFYHYLARTR